MSCYWLPIRYFCFRTDITGISGIARLLSKSGNRFKIRDYKFYRVDVHNPSLFLYLSMYILNAFICSKQVIFRRGLAWFLNINSQRGKEIPLKPPNYSIFGNYVSVKINRINVPQILPIIQSTLSKMCLSFWQKSLTRLSVSY